LGFSGGDGSFYSCWVGVVREVLISAAISLRACLTLEHLLKRFSCFRALLYCRRVALGRLPTEVIGVDLSN
jgi:hypothetical protein